jgi:hypothetical protein
MYSELNKRLDRIDRGVQKLEQTHALAACNCRGRGKKIVETKFHTAEELEKILWVPCPVHGIREPGFVCFTPPWCLLKKPDLKFCTCPPHPWRDFLIDRQAHPLPLLDSIEGVGAAIGQMIVDVHESRLDSRTAAGVAPLLNTLLRALGAAELEQKFVASNDRLKSYRELHRKARR